MTHLTKDKVADSLCLMLSDIDAWRVPAWECVPLAAACLSAANLLGPQSKRRAGTAQRRVEFNGGRFSPALRSNVSILLANSVFERAEFGSMLIHECIKISRRRRFAETLEFASRAKGAAIDVLD